MLNLMDIVKAINSDCALNTKASQATRTHKGNRVVIFCTHYWEYKDGTEIPEDFILDVTDCKTMDDCMTLLVSKIDAIKN